MSRQWNRRILLLTGLAVALCGLRPLPANVLTNPGFEDPVMFSPGNNFPPEVPGWTLVPSAIPCENGHNIVLTDASAYDGGPNRAADGSQYYDICGASGYLSQSFTIGRDSVVSFGASFSRRDAEGGGGNVAIYDATETTFIAESTFVRIEGRESQEIWRVSTGSIPNLAAGTYVFRINLDDTANVDAAFVYIGSFIESHFEAGNGTPGSISEGLIDWAMAAAGRPIVLHGGNVPYVVPLTAPKVINGGLLTLFGRHTATLSGQGMVNLFRIGPGGTLRLRDITLDRGFTSGSGGAIRNDGTLDLNNVRISNCVAGAHGGAIQNSNILTCYNCIFEYNRAGINGGALDTTVSAMLSGCVATNNAAGFRGGGFYNYTGYLSTGQCVLKWNTAGAYGGGLAVDGGTLRSSSDHFRGNRTDGSGGGMSLNGDCIVHDPQLTLNIAKGPGGAVDVPGGFNALLERPIIYSNAGADSALSMRAGGLTATVVRANFMHNGVTSGQTLGAGGIRVTAGAMTISDSLISSNWSPLRGGGLMVESPDTVNLKNCTFTWNRGFDGQVASEFGHLEMEDCRIGPGTVGGIASYGGTLTVSRTTVAGNGTLGVSAGGVVLGSNAMATMVNCTISGNNAAAGGGLHLLSGFGGGNADLTNVTVVGNAAQTGGNVYRVSGGSLKIRNTIIASPGGGGNCSDPGITSFGYNIFSDNLCPLTGPGDRIGTDPLLGPLQSNEGPTFTHLPLPGSPAIDGVIGTQAPQMDQRGATRPAGLGYDIGAVEANANGRILLAPPPAPTFDGYDRGDDDGDAVLDLDELIMGTDPNSPTSVLRLTRSPANPLQFTFPSTAGIYYRLYVSPNSLPDHFTFWVDAGEGTIAGDGGIKTITIVPVPGVKRRFYVLKVMRTDGPWP